jgi:signal peptidase II
MVSLGFVVGGTVGNLIDRVFRGTVTDFISVKYFPAVFNVADSAIVVGSLVLIICIVFYPHRMEIPGARQ